MLTHFSDWLGGVGWMWQILSVFIISLFLVFPFQPRVCQAAPPVFDDYPSDDSILVREGDSLEFGVGAYDPEGGTIFLSAFGLPPHGSFVDEGDGNGLFSCGPDFFQAWYTYELTFVATDDEGLTAQVEITILMIDVNQPPEITAFPPGPVSLDEGTVFIDTFEATDLTDPERGLMWFSTVEPLPPGAAITLLPATGGGVFSFAPDFDFTRQYPDTAFELTFRAIDRQGLASSLVQVIFWVNNVNRSPLIGDPGPQIVEEGDTLRLAVTATDLDGDNVTVQAEDLPLGATFIDGLFEWPTGYQDAGVHSAVFSAVDDGSPPLADSLMITITVEDANAPPTITSGPDQTMEVGDSVALLVSVWDFDEDDSISTVVVDPPSGTSFSFDAQTRNGVFRWVPDATARGVHPIIFECNDNRGEPNSIDRDTTIITVVLLTPFKMYTRTAVAWPGQQHVKVPVFLSNFIDTVGGWDILMEYDYTGCTVVGVEVCDSIAISDGSDEGIYYAPWHGHPELRPELFIPSLGVDGHENRIRVVALMDLEWPVETTPPILPGEEHLLFCFIVDVAPMVGGHQVRFNFQTGACTDNTLSGSNGATIWGPDEFSRPEWLVCPYDDVVRLIDGSGLAIREDAERGDINCDGVAYSVADALMFVRYLVDGQAALYGCPSFEAHCYAADIDGDGYCFTLNDLMILIRVINGLEEPPPKRMAEWEVIASLEERDGVSSVGIEGGGLVGSALFIFECDEEVGRPTLVGRATGMRLAFGRRAGKLNVLIYSMDGQAIEPGRGPVVAMPGVGLALEQVTCTDESGMRLRVRHRFIPSQFQLFCNFPNPFNSTTVISYSIPEKPEKREISTRLRIYNLVGQLVRTLIDEPKFPGYHEIAWDGRDDRGCEVASGIYLYRLQVGNIDMTRRMALLR